MVASRKTVLLSSIFLVVVVGVGAGLWWRGHSGGHQKAQGSQTVGDHTVSLDQPSASDNSGGLSVNSGGASDLGQLSSGDQSQSQDNSSSSGSAGNVDSSTFAQYDKYKNNKSALFGDIKAGNGTALVAGKKASVYYKGWLTDGTLFDRSRTDAKGQSQAFTFTMGAHQVIPGWEEAMDGMKAGGTRLLIVPPAAGYGSQGQGAVPPNAVLVFEVQLISVN